MKWIALAILIVIVPYTFLTLHYRKPGPAYRAYQDTKNRAITGRLLSAGYQRVAIDAQRPSDPGQLNLLGRGSPAAVAPVAGGLPTELHDALIDGPLLPVSIDRVVASATARAGEPYAIQFSCLLPDHKEQLAGAHLYRRKDELILVPSFEKLHGDLLARTDESTVLLTVPATLLPPGHYTLTLAGARTSRKWALQVH